MSRNFLSVYGCMYTICVPIWTAVACLRSIIRYWIFVLISSQQLVRSKIYLYLIGDSFRLSFIFAQHSSWDFQPEHPLHRAEGSHKYQMRGNRVGRKIFAISCVIGLGILNSFLRTAWLRHPGIGAPTVWGLKKVPYYRLTPLLERGVTKYWKGQWMFGPHKKYSLWWPPCVERVLLLVLQSTHRNVGNKMGSL